MDGQRQLAALGDMCCNLFPGRGGRNAAGFHRAGCTLPGRPLSAAAIQDSWVWSVISLILQRGLHGICTFHDWVPKKNREFLQRKLCVALINFWRPNTDPPTPLSQTFISSYTYTSQAAHEENKSEYLSANFKILHCAWVQTPCRRFMSEEVAQDQSCRYPRPLNAMDQLWNSHMLA